MSHYDALGVGQRASAKEISAAYRKLALRLHPDKNGGDPAATEQFKAVSHAYAVLSDPTARSRYDLHGSDDVGDDYEDYGMSGGFGVPPDFMDFMFVASMFGGVHDGMFYEDDDDYSFDGGHGGVHFFYGDDDDDCWAEAMEYMEVAYVSEIGWVPKTLSKSAKKKKRLPFKLEYMCHFCGACFDDTDMVPDCHLELEHSDLLDELSDGLATGVYDCGSDWKPRAPFREAARAKARVRGHVHGAPPSATPRPPAGETPPAAPGKKKRNRNRKRNKKKGAGAGTEAPPTAAPPPAHVPAPGFGASAAPKQPPLPPKAPSAHVPASGSGVPAPPKPPPLPPKVPSTAPASGVPAPPKQPPLPKSPAPKPSSNAPATTKPPPAGGRGGRRGGRHGGRGGGGNGSNKQSSRPCRFFNTPAGCRFGERCKFQHT